MIHTFNVSITGSLSARVAGSILAIIQATVGDEYDINLVYAEKIVDARDILCWLEFAFHEHSEFTIESNYPDGNDIIKEIQAVIDRYSK